MHVLDHKHQKLLKCFLTFLNLHQNTKNQLISSIISSIHLVTMVATTISDHTHPNIFHKLFNFWYQPVKIYKSRLFHSFVLEIYRFEILQSDCPMFWPNMTEKQTNRFTDFTFGFLVNREVRWTKI